MPAKLIDQTDNKLTIQFAVELTGQMLTDEQSLQKSLNEAGQVATFEDSLNLAKEKKLDDNLQTTIEQNAIVCQMK